MIWSPRCPEDFPYDDIGVGQDYPWSPAGGGAGVVLAPPRHLGMTARLVRDLTDTLEEDLITKQGTGSRLAPVPCFVMLPCSPEIPGGSRYPFPGSPGPPASFPRM